jgi:hypothetical protein
VLQAMRSSAIAFCGLRDMSKFLASGRAVRRFFLLSFLFFSFRLLPPTFSRVLSLHTDAAVEKFVASSLPVRPTITLQPFQLFESISPCELRRACSNTKPSTSVEKEAEERV